MNQQIAPSATSQTAPAALRSASGQDKPTGKGLFAKLVAMIEGKAETDKNAGSEKVSTSSAEAPIARQVKSKADKADADIFPVIKSEAQKARPQQEDSPDATIVNNNITILNHKHHKNKLLTAIDLAAANAKADVKAGLEIKQARAEAKQAAANTAADGKDASLTIKTNTDQAVKAGTEAKQAVANTAADGKDASLTIKANTDQAMKATAETKQAVANTAADGKDASLTIKANTDQAMKATAEAKQTAANTAADGKDASLTIKANTDQAVKAGTEAKQAVANTAADGKDASLTIKANTDQAVKAGTKTKQAAANAAASAEKAASTVRHDNINAATRTGHISIANEQRIAGIQPQQYSLSTNNFMHSHKLNSDNLSRPKVQLLQQASPGKKSVIATGNTTSATGNTPPPSTPAVTPLASNMRDMILQTDSLSRPNHQPAEAPNNQTFQLSNLDTASTFMRSTPQSLQAAPSSGPWPVTAAMQQIGLAAGQGKFQLELTLTPAHLGKVQVVLESDANKQIQVHLIIDQPASRQPIEQHLPALRQALTDQGLNMDSFSMESSGQHADNQQQHQNRNAPTGTLITDSSGSITKQADLPSDSRLSIRI